MVKSWHPCWKDAAPLRSLDTYSAEHQSIAQELIDFDREWSKIMSTRPFDPQHPERGGVRADEIQDFYMRSGEFTAGFGTQYRPSLLTSDGAHQSLAPGYPIGRRFAAAEVTRVADANPCDSVTRPEPTAVGDCTSSPTPGATRCAPGRTG